MADRSPSGGDYCCEAGAPYCGMGPAVVMRPSRGCRRQGRDFIRNRLRQRGNARDMYLTQH